MPVVHPCFSDLDAARSRDAFSDEGKVEVTLRYFESDFLKVIWRVIAGSSLVTSKSFPLAQESVSNNGRLREPLLTTLDIPGSIQIHLERCLVHYSLCASLWGTTSSIEDVLSTRGRDHTACKLRDISSSIILSHIEQAASAIYNLVLFLFISMVSGGGLSALKHA